MPIKYLGSKRRLVDVIGALFTATGGGDARSTCSPAPPGSPRSSSAAAASSPRSTAPATPTVFAESAIGTDADDARPRRARRRARARSTPSTGEPGYVTQTFCHDVALLPARERRPHRRHPRRDRAPAPRHPHFPILLTSLIEAADRVDSTTGVQMAYLKQWAPRAHQRLDAPAPGPARRARARRSAATRSRCSPTLGAFDFAYLDPPYNQHRYEANYHVWETIVAWDAPEHYGVACKRIELADRERTSVFNRTPRDARRAPRVHRRRRRAGRWSCRTTTSRGSRSTSSSTCARPRGAVEILAYDSKRYVGAQIGIHNPAGERVGEVSHLRNIEYLLRVRRRATARRAR